jgi:hypothetical protein
VVVVVGDVVADPAATGVTAPIPLSILKEVAFVVVQESVELSPACIDDGFALSVQVGRGGVTVTVTFAVQCTVPPEPVAVSVYVVVTVGVTDTCP